MEDQISNVHNAHHCCQFMYKGWQISLTTVPPQEVAVFKNVKDIRPFKIFRTVAEAIDWVNSDIYYKFRNSASGSELKKIGEEIVKSCFKDMKDILIQEE